MFKEEGPPSEAALATILTENSAIMERMEKFLKSLFGTALDCIPAENEEATGAPDASVANMGGTEPAMPKANLTRLVALEKELHERMSQIPVAPPMLKGVGARKYIKIPYKEDAALEPIQKNFRMPDIPKYDSTIDTDEHIMTFEALTKGALSWYTLLPKNSIDSFAALTDAFVKAHAGARRVETHKTDIFTVKQMKEKLLCNFMKCFQRERMQLSVISDDWVVAAFADGLNVDSSDASRKLKESLKEFPTNY
ncbi:hypothetical protein K7X08_023106 [Anisodus acutangulus]|uniref:Retrotransposon gag domain-containing protein n=1 Tax=Anisodus acutangulus TaxID=402998 RepID=A0A9Q1MBW4_9SOLA|nr:hypothetical protein K7X08_023106 [Anisodus acutangulus]